MQIHNISVGQKKRRKRIGRGGKRGTTSGRGMKGQKSRSGSSVDPLFEGGRSTFTERLKKLRGFKSIHPKKRTITLTALDQAFSDGETVTVSALVERGLLSGKTRTFGAKVVATGSLKKKLSLGQDVAASKKAREAFVA